MTRILRFVCPILAVGLLAYGYFLSGFEWPALGLLGFGIVWVVGLVLRWDWVPALGMFAAYAAAAVGFFLDPLPEFFIPAALLALLSWDLADFHRRLRKGSPEDDIDILEKHHLLRLFALALLGGGLSFFALKLDLKPSFGWMIILMVIAVWGIAQVVKWLSKQQS
jgi:hypothetical protein